MSAGKFIHLHKIDDADVCERRNDPIILSGTRQYMRRNLLKTLLSGEWFTWLSFEPAIVNREPTQSFMVVLVQGRISRYSLIKEIKFLLRQRHRLGSIRRCYNWLSILLAKSHIRIYVKGHGFGSGSTMKFIDAALSSSRSRAWMARKLKEKKLTMF